MSKQNVLLVRSGYKQTCKDPVLQAANDHQIEVLSIKAFNGTSGAINVGVGKRFANSSLKAYTLTAASTPDAADVTDSILGGVAVNLFTTTTNDGFLVGCRDKFSLIRFVVSQAESGSPVYAYSYYNGSAYVTLDVESVPSVYALGEQFVVFNPPVDWVSGTTAAVGGDSSYYYIRMIATTASGTVVQANAMSVAVMLDYVKTLPSLGTVTLDISATEGLILNAMEGVVPYFSGSVSSLNTCQVVYRIRK